MCVQYKDRRCNLTCVENVNLCFSEVQNEVAAIHDGGHVYMVVDLTTQPFQCGEFLLGLMVIL